VIFTGHRLAIRGGYGNGRRMVADIWVKYLLCGYAEVYLMETVGSYSICIRVGRVSGRTPLCKHGIGKMET